MLWYKAWRESRVRFLVSAIAIAGICLVRVLFERRFFPEVAHERPGVHTYIQYLYWTIFGAGGRGVMQLSCLLLGLGGLERDRKQNALGFTLSLPVSRHRLVLTRALVGYMQVFALSLLSPFVVWATSMIVRQSMPLPYGLTFVPFWTVGGFMTFGFTFLCSTLFAGEYTAASAGFVSYLFYVAVFQGDTQFGKSYPLQVADFMSGRLGNIIDTDTLLWTGTTSFRLFVGFSLAAVMSIAISTFMTTRRDL